MAPAWGFASADPSWNRMAAACGRPTTLRAAPASISPYPLPTRRSESRRELNGRFSESTRRNSSPQSRWICRYPIDLLWARPVIPLPFFTHKTGLHRPLNSSAPWVQDKRHVGVARDHVCELLVSVLTTVVITN